MVCAAADGFRCNHRSLRSAEKRFGRDDKFGGGGERTRGAKREGKRGGTRGAVQPRTDVGATTDPSAPLKSAPVGMTSFGGGGKERGGGGEGERGGGRGGGEARGGGRKNKGREGRGREGGGEGRGRKRWDAAWAASLETAGVRVRS